MGELLSLCCLPLSSLLVLLLLILVLILSRVESVEVKRVILSVLTQLSPPELFVRVFVQVYVNVQY